MSDNKREQERTELYRTIWALANELRGSVDGRDFKQYVLGMLFYRYISENLTTYLNKGEWDAGNIDFDYAKISDEEASCVRDDMVQEKGFFIMPSELFARLLKRIKKADKDAKEKAEKDGKEVEIADLDENLNEILQTNFKNIEASAIGSPSEENKQFPGIMYRGGAEQKIRKYLIDNNYIECIIQLPDNLFYGTSIATCIMVLKKSKVDNQTLFIDASKEFIKSTNSNKLGDGTASNEPNNIQNILNAYINRKTEKHFTALVKQEDIENADYNLSVSTYVESEDTREVIDITVLNEQISQIVQRENTLRAEIDAIIAEIEVN